MNILLGVVGDKLTRIIVGHIMGSIKYIGIFVFSHLHYHLYVLFFKQAWKLPNDSKVVKQTTDL